MLARQAESRETDWQNKIMAHHDCQKEEGGWVEGGEANKRGWYGGG